MDSQIPYNYVCIEGNIGSGKTTLCQLLAEEFNARMVLEQFAENPFLPYFYEDPERYAFPVELFFMTERHKQLQSRITERDLFQPMTVSDYFFSKTLLFARTNLAEEEYRLFQRLYYILDKNIPDPDLLVYLHRPINQLLLNIRERGRHFEQAIKSEYLQALQDAYFEYFRGHSAYPVLIIEVEDLDFAENRMHYEEIRQLIAKSYRPGVHRISLIH